MGAISCVWSDAGHRAVLLGFPGIGGHAGDFEGWGNVLARRGFVTAGCDLPGFGARRSEPLVDPHRATGEVEKAILEARHRWPGLPLIAAGESLGALVLLAAQAERRGRRSV